MANLANVKEVIADYNVTLTDELIYAAVSTSDITITLPPQPVAQGVKFTVLRINDGVPGFNAIVDGNGALINGAPQVILAPNENVTVISYDGMWLVPETNVFGGGGVGPTGPPGETGPPGPTGPAGSGGTVTSGRIYSVRNPGTFTASDTTILSSQFYGSTAVPSTMIQPGTQIEIKLRGSFSGITGSLNEFQVFLGGTLIHGASQTLTATTGTCPFLFDGVISVISISGSNATFRTSFLATIGKGNSSLPGDNSIGITSFSNVLMPITANMPIDVRYKHSLPGDSITILNGSIVVV